MHEHRSLRAHPPHTVAHSLLLPRTNRWFAAFCVAIDADGRSVLTGGDDGLVKLWSATSGDLVRTFRGHTAAIVDIALSPGNGLLATISLDAANVVRVWDVASGAPVAVLSGHGGAINALAWDRGTDGVLTTVGDDGTGRVWDLTAATALGAPPLVPEAGAGAFEHPEDGDVVMAEASASAGGGDGSDAGGDGSGACAAGGDGSGAASAAAGAVAAAAAASPPPPHSMNSGSSWSTARGTYTTNTHTSERMRPQK